MLLGEEEALFDLLLLAPLLTALPRREAIASVLSGGGFGFPWGDRPDDKIRKWYTKRRGQRQTVGGARTNGRVRKGGSQFFF